MLHDFFKNKIISQDMADIFSVKGINSLKGKSFYISGASGMLASYLTMFLIYLYLRTKEHFLRKIMLLYIRKYFKNYPFLVPLLLTGKDILSIYKTLPP